MTPLQCGTVVIDTPQGPGSQRRKVLAKFFVSWHSSCPAQPIGKTKPTAYFNTRDLPYFHGIKNSAMLSIFDLANDYMVKAG